MSMQWRCDRCSATADLELLAPLMPDGWRTIPMTARGLDQSVTSNFDATICTTCDIALYAWFHKTSGTP